MSHGYGSQFFSYHIELVKFSCISADINIGALDGIMGESVEGALKKNGNTLSRIPWI